MRVGEEGRPDMKILTIRVSFDVKSLLSRCNVGEQIAGQPEGAWYELLNQYNRLPR